MTTNKTFSFALLAIAFVLNTKTNSYALANSYASAKNNTDASFVSLISDALSAKTNERCYRSEWDALLEQNFERNNKPLPFSEALLGNGILCKDASDIRQFLSLLGRHDFPSALAKTMTVPRAQLLAKEARVLQETRSGVRIIVPENPQNCLFEIEGTTRLPEEEIRSLPGRLLHVRYLCGDSIFKIRSQVPVGAESFFLPPIPPMTQITPTPPVSPVPPVPSIPAIAPAITKSELSTASTVQKTEKNTKCEAGLSVYLNPETMHWQGINNTYFPILAEASCIKNLWKLEIQAGLLETETPQTSNLSQIVPNNSDNSNVSDNSEKSGMATSQTAPFLFTQGSFQRVVFQFFHQAQDSQNRLHHQLGIGLGLLAATHILTPLQATWGTTWATPNWSVSAQLKIELPLQSPIHNMIFFSLLLGGEP